MATINKHKMLQILRYLEGALADARAQDAAACGAGHEGNIAWRVRVARDWLLEAALTDVAVEPLGGAEIDATSAREAA